MTLEQRILNVVEEPLGLWAVQSNKRELRAITLEVRKMEDRIKRLEDAGDYLCAAAAFMGWHDKIEVWNKAKEDKP